MQPESKIVNTLCVCNAEHN